MTIKRRNTFSILLILFITITYLFSISAFLHVHVTDSGLKIAHSHPFTDIKHDSDNEIWLFHYFTFFDYFNSQIDNFLYHYFVDDTNTICFKHNTYIKPSLKLVKLRGPPYSI